MTLMMLTVVVMSSRVWKVAWNGSGFSEE